MNVADWNWLMPLIEDGGSVGNVEANEGPALISIAISLKRIADALASDRASQPQLGKS